MNSLLIKVLIVLTSTAQMGDTERATGFWLSELTHPYFEMVDNGIEVDIVSIQGGKVHIDPKSVNDSLMNKRFTGDPELVAKLENTVALESVDTSEYRAIVFAGGHGTMWDFPDADSVNIKAMEIYERGGIVAAICHGPAALINMKLPDGQYLIDGKEITAYTNEEEFLAGLTNTMPFLLEDMLIERGARFSNGLPWTRNVVVDGRLITGQNPRSSSEFGKVVTQTLLSQ